MVEFSWDNEYLAVYWKSLLYSNCLHELENCVLEEDVMNILMKLCEDPEGILLYSLVTWVFKKRLVYF